MDMLLYGAIAALGFGFVIFIHELGHFLFAKWAGVRVLRFSIGFGPVLLKWTRGETDYALSLLPLGGYVQMAGEEVVDTKAGTTTPEPGSFQTASYGWRALILLGGVLFNLISSWIILLFLALWGMPLMSSRVGDISPTVVDHTGSVVASPASQLGIQAGDRIVALNGDRVRSFEDVLFFGAFAGGRPVQVTVERHGKTLVLPATGSVLTVYDPSVGRSVLGIALPESTRIAGALRPDGREAGANDLIRPGDRVIGIDGVMLPVISTSQEVDLTGQELIQRIHARGGAPVRLTLQRGAEQVEVTTRINAESLALPARLDAIEAGGPADRAGLRVGDVVMSIDGVALRGLADLFGRVHRSGTTSALRLEVDREGQRITCEVTPAMLGRPRLGVTLGLPQRLPAGFNATGAALAVGLSAGDFLLSVQHRAENGELLVRSATGGSIRAVTVPGDTRAMLTWLKNDYDPPALLRLLGWKERPSPLSKLTAGSVADPVKAGVGLTPAAVRIRSDAGAEHIVDLAGFGAQGQSIANALALLPGERVLGVQASASGAVFAIATGLSPVRSATTALGEAGWTLMFTRGEERPYTLQSPSEAFSIVWDASHHMIVKSLLLIPRFFASPEAGGIDANKTLTGPVGMFRTLKQKAEYTGFDGFLRIVALVGLNLVLVNLLPIPVTDGGQLVFLGLEALRGKPVSMRVRMVAAILGTALVLGLMAYVIGLDLLRLAGFL